MSKRWSASTTMEFLEELRARQCLWNDKSPDFHYKSKREEAFRELADAMGLEGFGVREARVKVKNLKATYAQEMKKIADSKKAGGNFKSNLKWLKLMEPMYKERSRAISDDISYLVEELESPTRASSSSPTLNRPRATPAKRPAAASRRPVDARRRARRCRDASPSTQTPEDDAYDVYDVFGRSVAMQLRRFGAETALTAQSRIQSVLTAIGLEELRRRSQHERHDEYDRADSSSTKIEFVEAAAAPQFVACGGEQETVIQLEVK